MPLLGLGTWQSPKGQVYQAVLDAINAGYRHLDCAYIYQNEEEVGQAIAESITKGVVTREQLFVTSKCWLTFYSRERVEKSLRRTLTALGLEYLDLFLIHWPFGLKDSDTELFPENEDGTIAQNTEVDYTDTWKGMEDVKQKGLVKAIGISNFIIPQIERLLKVANIVPAVNQIELHPMLIQTELVDYCKSKGIVVTAYSLLGSTPPANPDGSARPSLLESPVVNKIADKYGKKPAQVLIRYHVQRGVVAIPKSVTKERIEANGQVFDFELTPEEITELESLNTGHRFCRFNIK